MDRKIDLLYVIIDVHLTIDNSPVFQSQILDRICMQREAGLCVGVIAIVDDSARFSKLVVSPLEEIGVSVCSVPNRNSLLRNLLSMCFSLRRYVTRHETRHIYVRGIWGAFAYRMAFPFGEPPLIYDFRGDLVSEAAARGASILRQVLLKILCRVAFSCAEKMLAVSRPAADMLALEYGRPGAIVFPSGVDVNWFQRTANRRDAVRRKYGVKENEILIAYAGGLSQYQMIPEMLTIWKELGASPDIRFLLLTNQSLTARNFPNLDLLKEIPFLIYTSVPRREIPEYLAASDIGFLLREEHPLNDVASPVKFGEYLASGLAVVTSPGLGDVSRVVVERDVGVLVRPKELAEAVVACSNLIMRMRQDRDGFRQRSLTAVYKERWDWREQANEWCALLGRQVV